MVDKLTNREKAELTQKALQKRKIAKQKTRKKMLREIKDRSFERCYRK